MTSAATSTPPVTGRPVGRGLLGRSLLIDTAVALTLGALLVAHGVMANELAADMPGVPAPTALAYGSGLVMCLALIVRRRYPLTVLVVVAVTFTLYSFNQGSDPTTSSVALFIAMVTAGSDGAPLTRDWVRGVVIVALFATIFYAFATDQNELPAFALVFMQGYSVALNIFYFAAAWVLGDQIRLRRHRERDLERRTAQLSARTLELEAERERSAEKAAVDERLRIARELHDVLGHHVSVMGVQAGAARHILDREPTRAREALQAIEGSSRQATTELQRVLRLLREDDGGPEPIGALDRIEELVGDVRRAGLDVVAQVADLPRLPVELDLAAVRIIQESLTNALRHGGPDSSAWVKVRADDEHLHIEVGDDGSGRPAPDAADPGRDGAGTGLLGMRERTEVHGGSFDAGPTRPRGWRVRARLPLAGPPASSDVSSSSSTSAPVSQGRR